MFCTNNTNLTNCFLCTELTENAEGLSTRNVFFLYESHELHGCSSTLLLFFNGHGTSRKSLKVFIPCFFFLTNTELHGKHGRLFWWRSQPHGLPRPWEGGGEGAGGISTFSVRISRIIRISFLHGGFFLTNTDTHGDSRKLSFVYVLNTQNCTEGLSTLFFCTNNTNYTDVPHVLNTRTDTEVHGN